MLHAVFPCIPPFYPFHSYSSAVSCDTDIR